APLDLHSFPTRRSSDLAICSRARRFCPASQFPSASSSSDLNALDPYKIWTWAPASRRPDPNSTKRQLPMWHHYRVELYPHFPGRSEEHTSELQSLAYLV